MRTKGSFPYPSVGTSEIICDEAARHVCNILSIVTALEQF